MIKPLLISLFGLAILGANGGLAMKERILFEPQIHKVGPGNDPDFSAVPEANEKQQLKDLGGAFDFLTDLARFKADRSESRQQYEDENYLDVDPRRDDQPSFGLYTDDDDDDDRINSDVISEKFYQGALRRLNAEMAGEMNADSVSTTTHRIQNAKAPSAAALQHQQHQSAAAKNAEGIDFVMIALLTCLAVAAAVGVIVSVFCFVKLQKRSRSSQRYDYSGPGNGAGKYAGHSGSGDSLNGSAAAAAASRLTAIFGGGVSSGSHVDKKLANNATLYHFEHHKKEMMAAESVDVPPEFGDSDADSVDENDENDYTVYECPGLAPTGEMQVDNPLFRIKQQASQPGGSPPSSISSSAHSASPPVVVHGQQSGSPK